MLTIDYLLENSKLPGPRGNLELLYSFSQEADRATSQKCLAYIKEDTANSPEEFVGMCGIVSYAVLNKDNVEETIKYLSKYASHGSWRIREAVAIGIQEIAEKKMELVLKSLEPWARGNALEKRAVVAALCEPKLLSDQKVNQQILKILETITQCFASLDKLTEEEKILRKSLGYGWSVLIVALPEAGKKSFQAYLKNKNKHINWIVKENLKKNRLLKMDKEWVDSMAAALGII